MKRTVSRAVLARLFAAALREVDPTRRVHEALPPRPMGDRPARVVVIGKAAPAMAAGALARWGRAIERCVVVVPDDTAVERLHQAAARARVRDRVVVVRASHPLPDARSVNAGALCLDTVATSEPRAILVLVSGGASALVCAPADGITLAQKRGITRAMLVSGASVRELNTVRKHLSRIKGGGLLRAAAPNRVLTLVVSDVLDGAPSDVGSGPSVPDTSSVADARRLLRRHALAFADVALAPTIASAADGRARIIASPEELASAMVRLLRERGIDARRLASSVQPVEELAAEYVAWARSALRSRKVKPRALVRVAEPAVVVPDRDRAARGGRSSHLAALVGRELAPPPDRYVLFAALATDGVDGSSGTAGAIVDARFASRAVARLGPSAIERAVARFDTGPLHVATGTALPRHPTGHNLADLHVLIVE